MLNNSLAQATTAIHGGEGKRETGNAMAQPPVLSTSYFTHPDAIGFSATDLKADAPHFYTRWSNPTLELLEKRLALLEGTPGFRFQKLDVADRAGMAALFSQHAIDRIVHLAAQAGVRYSITHPHAYGEANLTGFLNVLECARQAQVKHLVYASSSSVYGGNEKMPFSEADAVDHPVSLYAATKKANEVMAHTYSHLYRIPTTGLRFFTVYGPWGRPDMAPLLFSRAVLAGRPIEVFNQGRMKRDFTHVDDIVAGVLGALDHPSGAPVPHRVFNLGNHTPVELEHFIAVIEQAAGRPAQKVYKPMQPGDMVETMADTRRAREAFGFDPATPIEAGLPPVVQWCRDYFGDRA